MKVNPESDVTLILTRGGLSPSTTSSTILSVTSVNSDERIAINGDDKNESFLIERYKLFSSSPMLGPLVAKIYGLC